MKQNMLIGTLALCSILMASACKEETPPPEHEFKTFRTERTERLNNDADAPSGRILIEMDYLTAQDSIGRSANRTVMQRMYERSVSLAPQAAADSFATEYLKRYREDLQELYSQEKKTQVTKAWYEYSRTIAAHHLTGSKELIQYEVTHSFHEGGSAPYEEKLFLNFDARSGVLLTADSIFKKGSRIELEALLLQELEEEQDVKSLEELRQKGFLRLTNMYATDNFLLLEEGICFYYQRDELASYEAGPVEIHLSYKKLKNILTDKTKDLWSRF
jgi:hypothetical protein